jgi:hypothetical protein
MLRDYTNRSREFIGLTKKNLGLHQGVCLWLCFYFLSHTVSAQVFPLPEQNPEWILSTNGLNGPSEERFDLTGESLTIRGEEWPIVQRTSTVDFLGIIDTIVSPIGAYFVDGDKVFFKEPTFGYEGLLYDFSAEIGDVFFIISPATFATDSAMVTVMDKKVTTCSDGTSARTLFLRLNDFECNLIWQEGAGEIVHPFISDRCVSVNCDVVYEGNRLSVDGKEIVVSEENDCLTSSQSLPNRPQTTFDLYPNPAYSGTIDLVIKGLANTRNLMIVTITNYLGQSVKQWQGMMHNDISTRIDVQGLKPGSYFAVLQNGDGLSLIRKFVVID